MSEMFKRQSLADITEVPEDIISVYAVEKHIWAEDGAAGSRAKRQPELRTIQEFLIDPVRPFLNDFFRQLSAPYIPDRADTPIGQGFWIQAEFGSGKSHLLSFIGALALGNAEAWSLVQEKEAKAGKGKRDSLYWFYENGLQKKSTAGSHGILVAVKTLIGFGGAATYTGEDRNLADYVMEAVAEQFHQETGKSLPLFPDQQLAERFLNSEDSQRYRKDLEKFLKDPNFLAEDEQEELNDFLRDLQESTDPATRRDLGDKLWRFYREYLKITPTGIEVDPEPLLEHMMHRLLDAGYAGLLIILDEVSLYMKDRDDKQRAADERALVVLANRLAHVKHLPVWTVAAAQQAIESKMAGSKNIIADERLKEVTLLNKPDDYYNIALHRVRTITKPEALDKYYQDYRRSFSWVDAHGRDRFDQFFPFYPPAMEVVRALSNKLTTVRSALYFMLQTLKTQRKKGSDELISLWALFDDVVNFEEDPSGTTRGITSVRSKFPDEWQAYEAARHLLGGVTQGRLKVYRPRAEKIIKTLFLYHVANMATNGLGAEDLMNAVMEWKDAEQKADLEDNRGHYELLADDIALALAQVKKQGANYLFEPKRRGVDPQDLFDGARAEVANDEKARREAWDALLKLGPGTWTIRTPLQNVDFSFDVRTVFHTLANAPFQDLRIHWHGREILGRAYLRELREQGHVPLPNLTTPDSDLDFALFVSPIAVPSTDLHALAVSRSDPRALYWAPAEANENERGLLLDFAAYRRLVADYRSKDTQDARDVMNWVVQKLGRAIGVIAQVVPDRYRRGHMTARGSLQLSFAIQGELPALIEPVVGYVLDSVYLSKSLEFKANVPFDDAAALNVINGLVKLGEISANARPTKETSASDNFGADLRILKVKDRTRILDIEDNPFTNALYAWITDKLKTVDVVPMSTVYKNFMGIDGPNKTDYGLSKRLVQIYVLCLVRTGKLRVRSTNRLLAPDWIDYANIAETEFKTALLESLGDLQAVRPPEGWELFAPFAARLLNNAALANPLPDADVQAAIQKVRDEFETRLSATQSLQRQVNDLFAELGQPNPYAEDLAAWIRFYGAPIEPADPLTSLRNALDMAFDYRVYRDDRSTPADHDDFQTRLDRAARARRLADRSNDLRMAARYAAYPLPALPEMAETRAALAVLPNRLADLPRWAETDVTLENGILQPARQASEAYAALYLTAYDRLVQRIGEARAELDGLRDEPAYRALTALGNVRALGPDTTPALDEALAQHRAALSQLMPEDLTHETVARDLRQGPEPRGCPLRLDNAESLAAQVKTVVTAAQAALAAALTARAALLISPALRQRLELAAGDPLIASLLGAPDAPAAAAALAEGIGGANASAAVARLERQLKTLRVTRLRLSDFRPSKTTLEARDLDATAAEFRAFLQSGLAEGGPDDLPMIELE